MEIKHNITDKEHLFQY